MYSQVSVAVSPPELIPAYNYRKQELSTSQHNTTLSDLFILVNSKVREVQVYK